VKRKISPKGKTKREKEGEKPPHLQMINPQLRAENALHKAQPRSKRIEAKKKTKDSPLES
jgi:hypothetical protein